METWRCTLLGLTVGVGVGVGVLVAVAVGVAEGVAVRDGVGVGVGVVMPVPAVRVATRWPAMRTCSSVRPAASWAGISVRVPVASA